MRIPNCQCRGGAKHFTFHSPEECRVEALSRDVKREIPQVKFPSIGVGIMRSTAAYIVLLLSLESPAHRASIITSALEEMGITIEDLKEGTK